MCTGPALVVLAHNTADSSSHLRYVDATGWQRRPFCHQVTECLFKLLPTEVGQTGRKYVSLLQPPHQEKSNNPNSWPDRAILQSEVGIQNI